MANYGKGYDPGKTYDYPEERWELMGDEARKPLRNALGGQYGLGQATYMPDESAWDVKYGVPSQYERDRQRARQSIGSGTEKYYDSSLSRMLQARAKQSEAMGLLRTRAMGGQTVAEQQGELARETTRQQIASQLAGARGGYSPAGQRGAQMALGTSLASQGAQTQIAAAKERQLAQEAYMKAASGIRGQDLTGMGRATTQEGRLVAGRTAAEKTGMDYARMGLGEKYAKIGMKQQYQKMRQARDMQLQKTALQAQGLVPEEEGTDWGGIGMGGISL